MHCCDPQFLKGPKSKVNNVPHFMCWDQCIVTQMTVKMRNLRVVFHDRVQFQRDDVTKSSM